MTNREWLESLSDEELAQYFTETFDKPYGLCDMCNYHCKIENGACLFGVMDWLQAEHEGDKKNDDTQVR